MALWTDPDGAPAHNVVYHARVLEVPTPRWSTYDAVAANIEPGARDPLGKGVDVTGRVDRETLGLESTQPFIATVL